MEFIKKNFHYLLLLSSVFFLGNPAKFPVDDGFFYPQIAYNIVHHGFMGFNDLYLTNGFHPLWMVFCVIAELLNPFDKQFALNILWLFQVIFIFSGFKLLEKTVFKNSELGKTLGLAFYTFIFFGIGALYLTEAHLAFFTLSLLFFFVWREFKNDLVFGFICSLVFLSRLDHIFIIVPFGFFYWNFRNWNYKSLIMILLGFSFLSLPYLLSNIYLFESAVPISGKIKSSFPIITDEIPFGILFKFCFAVCFLYLIFLFFNSKTEQRFLKICFVIGCLLHFFYNIFYQSQIGQWYFVSQFMLFGFFINDISARFNFSFTRNKVLLTIFSSFLVILICFFGYMKLTTNMSLMSNLFGNDSKVEKKQVDKMKEISEDLTNLIPAKSRIYIYDFPGKFAFYSDLNFIPADALVGNSTFFKDIDNRNFKEYLKKNGINYLLFPSRLTKNEKEIYFMGLNIKKEKSGNVFYIKNTMKKSVVDSLREKDLFKIKEYENPAKTWQINYDSVSIYKTKF